MVAFAAVAAGCGDDTTPPEAQIKRVLVDQWQSRYAGKPGGLTAAIITPRGEHVASTIDGVGPGSHFRGASTTKTFTAAAIMLLEQRGNLERDREIGRRGQVGRGRAGDVRGDEIVDRELDDGATANQPGHRHAP
ncbi:MAG: serine hydrolase [Betaproteobacteria bacterium]